MDGVNKKLLKDVVKYREFIENDDWGLFKSKTRPHQISEIN